MMNKRIQVHHNYISAVSSLEHKKDLINRLKRCDTHNIPAYEAEMSHHMTLHEDVLERIVVVPMQKDGHNNGYFDFVSVRLNAKDLFS